MSQLLRYAPLCRWLCAPPKRSDRKERHGSAGHVAKLLEFQPVQLLAALDDASLVAFPVAIT